jgi:signal peptidase II
MLHKKNLHWLWLSVLIIVVDQITKYFALLHLSFLEPIRIFPFFNLSLDYNAGAAFSFLSASSGWQRWFFIAVAIIMSILVFAWLLKTKKNDRWQKISLALILGGAIGNLWDRLTLGYVIDFIDLFVKNWHWPIFNIADSAITIGVLMLVIGMISEA